MTPSTKTSRIGPFNFLLTIKISYSFFSDMSKFLSDMPFISDMPLLERTL